MTEVVNCDTCIHLSKTRDYPCISCIRNKQHKIVDRFVVRSSKCDTCLHIDRARDSFPCIKCISNALASTCRWEEAPIPKSKEYVCIDSGIWHNSQLSVGKLYNITIEDDVATIRAKNTTLSMNARQLSKSFIEFRGKD